MPTVKQPANVSSITVGGFVLNPSYSRVSPTNPLHVAILLNPTTRARFVSSDGTATTIYQPSIVTSITINSVAYTPDASGFIYVPIIAATAYLEGVKYSRH